MEVSNIGWVFVLWDCFRYRWLDLYLFEDIKIFCVSCYFKMFKMFDCLSILGDKRYW